MTKADICKALAEAYWSNQLAGLVSLIESHERAFEAGRAAGRVEGMERAEAIISGNGPKP